MYTHWQIEGYCWEKRDDVLKAIQSMASMMNVWDEFWGYERRLMDFDRNGLMAWKTVGNLFEIPGAKFSPFNAIPTDVREQVRGNLSHVLGMVRSLGITDPVPYDAIIDSLYDTQELLKPLPKPTGQASRPPGFGP